MIANMPLATYRASVSLVVLQFPLFNKLKSSLLGNIRDFRLPSVSFSGIVASWILVPPNYFFEESLVHLVLELRNTIFCCNFLFSYKTCNIHPGNVVIVIPKSFKEP